MEDVQRHLENIHILLDKIDSGYKIIYEGFQNLSMIGGQDVYRFDSEVNRVCIEYLMKIQNVQSEEISRNERKSDLKYHYDVFVKFQSGLKDIMNRYSDMLTLDDDLVPTICYNDHIQSNKLNLSIINRYCGSYYYNEYYSDRRTENGSIYIDHDSKNEDLIMKYMNDEHELIDDINNLNVKERYKMLEDLDFLNLPLKIQFVSLLGYDEDDEIMEGWRKKQMVMSDDKYYKNVSNELRKNGKIEETYNERLLKDIRYDDENKCFGIDIDMKYIDIIEDYLSNERQWNSKLLKVKQLKYDDIVNEMSRFRMNLNDEEKNELEKSWMNVRSVFVNRIYNQFIDEYLKNKNYFVTVYIKNMNSEQFDANNNLYVNIELKYHDIIEDYIVNNREWNSEMIQGLRDYDSDELIDEFGLLDIKLSSIEISRLKGITFSFVETSKILNNSIYDIYLKEWLGTKYEWKCMYRASEHGYTSDSFHEYCDDVGPSIVIIKSHNSYLFGGYTTKSWKANNIIGSEFKIDKDAFIFTLYNAHNMKPTHYSALNDKGGIGCYPDNGPLFCGKDNCYDILINYDSKNCNEKESCYINNDGSHGYECDPQYKSSLFVNTNKPNDSNDFSVDEYEVFGIDFKDLDMVMKITGHSLEIRGVNIIEEPLISPSEMLNGTKIVDIKYDKYLYEWLGTEYEWKLIYRASEHEYTSESFHEYCDNVGPTLVIIKSHNGYIFGGYTTKSWKGYDWIKIDNDAFLFTLYNAHNIVPTRYNVLKDKGGIECDPNYGPIFCVIGVYGIDICIQKNCNKLNSCMICSGTLGYECDSHYERSLFVDTARSDERNEFSVLDYEVFAINNIEAYMKITGWSLEKERKEDESYDESYDDDE